MEPLGRLPSYWPNTVTARYAAGVVEHGRLGQNPAQRKIAHPLQQARFGAEPQQRQRRKEALLRAVKRRGAPRRSRFVVTTQRPSGLMVNPSGTTPVSACDTS